MRRRPTIVGILAALCLTAGGVAVTAGAPAGAQTDPPANQVVRLGVLAPLEDGLTDFGLGILNSVQLAVDQANQRERIPGWTIEVMAVDDSSEPAIGAAGAQLLVADPAVVGVVGPYNSGVADAALPVLAPADLALVSPSNTLTSLTLGPNPDEPLRPFDDYFRMVASDAEQAVFLAESIAERGAENVSVVSETKAVSKGLADAFAAAFEDGGGTITGQVTVPDGTTDFTDLLDTIVADEPDMVFFGGEYPVAAALRTALTAANYKGPLVGGDGIKDDAYVTDAGAASRGTLASTVGVPADRLKSAKKFLAAYEKAGYEEDATDYGPYAYDAANVIIAALADVLDGQTAIPADARAQVVAGIQATKTKGASGKISFDELGDTTHRVFTLYRVEGPKGGALAFAPIKP